MFKNGTPYLSVNDSLYPFSDLDTVADSGYYEAVSLSKTFSKLVGTLPSKDSVTAQYQGAVQQVRDLYDGMTEYQKQFINADDLSTFEAIESRVNELVAARDAAEQESEAAEEETAEDTTEEEAETLAEDTISPEALAALTEDSQIQAEESSPAAEEA
jgi:flagellar basal-body rod modification protein FlgD